MPKIGRPYQHIEDFLIEGGSQAVLDVVEHMKKVVDNPSLLDYKWDGSASIYWGRSENGDFFFIPKNQWSKGKLLSRSDLRTEILNTGRKHSSQTEDEFNEAREGFADLLTDLWDLFESNTPKKFRGFLNGDLIFTEPLGDDLTVTPNKVTFRFEENAFGGRIQSAKCMAVVHGKFSEFGLDTIGNIQEVDDSEIENFNQSNELIVLNTQTPDVESLSTIERKLNILDEYVNKYHKNIDMISEFSQKGFTTLKSKLYKYSVTLGKSRESLSVLDWVKKSKLSDNHKKIIWELSKTNQWDKFWGVYLILQSLKLDILSELFKYDTQTEHLGISMSINGYTGGEGYVTEMEDGRIIKIINPEFRYSDTN